MTREPHALGSQSVKVGSGNLLLSVAAQLAPAEVIREDEHHVEGRRPGGRCGGGTLRQPWERQNREQSQSPEPERCGNVEISPHR